MISANKLHLYPAHDLYSIATRILFEEVEVVLLLLLLLLVVAVVVIVASVTAALFLPLSRCPQRTATVHLNELLLFGLLLNTSVVKIITIESGN